MGETYLLWLKTIIYGHEADEYQNPRKIRVFPRPFAEGFLARGIVRASPARFSL